jgi:dipeptidyl aminopeptidase/acylaminoacyl peptidase
MIHGELDPLVPLDQVYGLFETLKAAGVPVDLRVYPGEQNALKQYANRAEAWSLTLNWFATYLR